MPSQVLVGVSSLWPWRKPFLLQPHQCCNAKRPHRYPLITLSTRAQVESKRAQSSTYDAIRRIVHREGVTGLYSGLDSALFGISVTNFVYYYCSYLSLSIRATGRLTRPQHRQLTMSLPRVRVDPCLLRTCSNPQLARI